jgi:hypothetical protein
MAATRTAKRKASREPQPRVRRTPARPRGRTPPAPAALRPAVLDGVNRSAIVVRLKDVHGAAIADTVEFTLYNQRAGSLNQRFRVKTRARAVRLDSVPAFPFGVAEVFIAPDAYRFKQVFVTVPAGEPAVLDETLFIDPARATPTFPTFADLQSDLAWATLLRILDASGIRSETDWKDGLDPMQKAGLLNLHAKLRKEVVATGESLLDSVVRVTEFQPERIYAEVTSTLYDRVRELPHVFRVVSGALHRFPHGYTRVEGADSFKTYDRAGNLQLTFARNAAGDFMADIDIDDHQGIQHAADVLRHKITGRNTHPYDIHQILLHFQGLDPGYRVA